MSSPFPNPPSDFSVLVAPTTRAIVLKVITDALVSMGIRADLWQKEGVAISITTQVANVFAAAINGTIIPAIKSGLLPTSTGNWLTWLSLYMYGQRRILATFATGQVTLTNNGGGLFAFGPGEVIFQNPNSIGPVKKTYTNVDPIALAPGPGPTQTINVVATEQGTASNANPGDISVIVTTMLSVSVTNLFPVLAIDDQTDASLQLQDWNSIAANSAFGPRQSYAYAIQTALNSVSGNPVNVNRWLVSPSSHTGRTQVWIASPTGIVIPTDVLGVIANIEAIARPPGVTVSVASVTTVPDTDTLTVYVRASPGLDAAAVLAAMQTALSIFFSGANGTNPIGGTRGAPSAFITQGLYVSALYGVCFDAWPPKPTDPTIPWVSAVVEVTSANELARIASLVGPGHVDGLGGDVALLPSQVATDAITVVVRLI